MVIKVPVQTGFEFGSVVCLGCEQMLPAYSPWRLLLPFASSSDAAIQNDEKCKVQPCLTDLIDPY